MGLGEWLGVAALVVAVVALPITYLFGRRNRQEPDLRYVCDHDILIASKDGLLSSGIVVSKDGHPISGISRSCFAIWNHRGDVVDGKQMVRSDPIRLQCAKTDRILRARVLARSREQNGLSIVDDPSDPSAALIVFDFLASKDGAIIEIIHEGPESATVAGTVKGAQFNDRGSANLSLDRLVAMSENRYYRRALRYLGGRRRDGRKRWPRLILPVAMSCLLVLVGLIGMNLTPDVPPHLVSASNYNLSSLAGQAKFAQVVNSSQYGGSRWIFVLAAIYGASFLAMMFVLIAWTSGRSPVPRQVVRLVESSDELDAVSRTSIQDGRYLDDADSGG